MSNNPVTFDRVIKKLGKINIRTGWFLHELQDNLFSQVSILECPICGFKNEVSTCKELTTNCIHSGGRLVRHECTNCGVIFGTQRMLAMTPEKLSQEYARHYIYYNEGDSTGPETQTFRYLNPKPDGIYLNYGCGKWSNTIATLRDEGYQVFGFEPHAVSEQDCVIQDIAQLKSIKFDGIFSNDVLEHLRYPAETLKFMASLLKEDGIMAHTTHCYEYDCEFTRFHLFFFTGKSLEVICQQAGLRYIETDTVKTKLFQKLN